MSHKGFRLERQASRFTWLVGGAAAALLCCEPRARAELAEPEAVARLSQSEMSSLRNVAHTNPCAATVLLHVRGLPRATAEGVLYLEQIPSGQGLERMLDHVDGSAPDAWAPTLPRNPYSSAEFFVELRWSMRNVDDLSAVLTTRAQLVDRLGAPFQPVHEIESATTVLWSRGTFHVLGRPDTL